MQGSVHDFYSLSHDMKDFKDISAKVKPLLLTNERKLLKKGNKDYSKFQRWKSKFIFTDKQCPGDGSCSNQGTCDVLTGLCSCDEGFQGKKCQGNIFLFWTNIFF